VARAGETFAGSLVAATFFGDRLRMRVIRPPRFSVVPAMKTNTQIRPRSTSLEQTALRGMVRAGMAFAMAGPGAALAGGSFAGVVGAARWQDAAQPAGFTLAGVALVMLAVAVSLPGAPYEGLARLSAWCWAVSLVAVVVLSLRAIGPSTTTAITVLGGLSLAGAGRWLAEELTED
jgi:hypothetical protein